jgi:hypothetical protein
MKKALKGWTKSKTVKIVTQSIVDHETSEATASVTLKINFQPMPTAQVNRKPEEQRTWKWWSIIIEDGTTLLKTDDIVIKETGRQFRIMSANDWRESGFSKYEAIEDYE